MSFSSGVAIYVVLWSVVLFAVLPFGVRNRFEAAEEGVAGTDPGAPVIHGMWRKVVATSLISAVLMAAGMAAHQAGYLSISWLAATFRMPY